MVGLVVDNSGIGPERPAGGPDGSGLEDPNLQHRADLDPRNQSQYRVDFGGFGRGRINSITIPAPIRSRISCPICKPPPSARTARLTDLGGQASISYVARHPYHQGGSPVYDEILTENDSFGIVDPTFNPVCLDADGSPNTNPLLINPRNCTGPCSPTRL